MRRRELTCLLALWLLLLAGGARLLAAQTVSAAPHAGHRLFVEPFPELPGSSTLQAAVIDRLKSAQGVQLVSNASQADAIVSGEGETWVEGHVTDSIRGGNRQPVVSGYLALQLKDSAGHPLWSYLVTPGHLHWNGIERDMADHIVRLLVGALSTPALLTVASSSSGAGQVSLAGAGATFPAPLYQQWIEDFEAQHSGVQISYQAVGSEQGIDELVRGQIDFAASDAALSDQQMAAAHASLLHFATVLGAVVPAYNLPSAGPGLRFTPELLAAIYLGRVTRWNDPEVRAVNRGATLPDTPIVVIHRSDGSGTTAAFTGFLAATVPVWKTSVGSGLRVTWPVGQAAQGNEGVAAAVASTPGAIGYVEFTYALRHHLNDGLVRNAAGEFVQANLTTLNAAAADLPASHGEDFRLSLLNAPGKDAYPIATLTWLLVPKDRLDAQKSAALDALLRWMLTSGQKQCSALGYLPLPKSLVDRELAALSANP